MQKPDLSRTWETFIKMSLEDVDLGRHIKIIRSKISPLVSWLKNNDIVSWYCFFIHDSRSGVPTSEDDKNPYFHIRFALEKDVDHYKFLASLPDYCAMTRKIKRDSVETISGIDKSILKNEEIEEAWRIIGEQSEWLLNMLNIHKEDADVSLQQISQFLHFYANMTQLQIR